MCNSKPMFFKICGYKETCFEQNVDMKQKSTFCKHLVIHEIGHGVITTCAKTGNIVVTRTAEEYETLNNLKHTVEEHCKNG